MQFITWLLFLITAHAEAPVQPAPESPQIILTAAITPETTISTTTTQEATVRQLIDKYATKYHVDANTMWLTVKCECPDLEFDCPSHVIRKDGTEEPSFGLAQIYRTAHPEIPYDKVIDPDFALDFMASYMSIGRYSMWSCYTMLHKYGIL